MIEPHHSLHVWRADEIAECWHGVPDGLYNALWNKIVACQTRIPQDILEDSGPGDHVGRENVAMFWDKLAPDEQALLNLIAERNQ